jgi:tRNA G18 (ribose-2'-O)-methylase SpoU
VRYKSSSTDTLNVPARIPLIEVNDWNTFVENSPRSAVWVVIEMGGTPLREFVHPRNAIYILGSEDHGVPTNVLRACREVVSLEAQEYSSYNVAVAGSIVMYDRLTKMREFDSSTSNRTSGDEK